jgi:hypothetical protein
MILWALTVHQTSTSGYAKELHEEHGDLEHQYLLFWRFTFPSNVNLS